MTKLNNSRPRSPGRHDRRQRRHGHGASCLSAAMLVALGVASRADAIQFIQDYNEIARPAFDPNGTELRRIATAAAIIWEDYILDDRTFEYELSWDNIDRLGEFHFFPGFSKKIIIVPFLSPYSLVMVLGLAIWWTWKCVSPKAVERYDFAVASGLIAGEGLMGVVNAVLTILGVEPLT